MAFNLFPNGFMPSVQNNSDMLLQTGLGLLGGQTPQQQVAGAAQGIAGIRQKNKTLDYLRQVSPDLAGAVDSGALAPGDAYKLFYQSKLKSEKPLSFQTLPDGTYGFADPDKGTFTPLGKAPSSGANGAGKFGLNPIWGTINGQPALVQPGTDGSVNQMKFPDGFVPNPGFNNLDAGTSIIPQDKKSGALGAPIPKNLSGAAAETATGKAQGENLVAAQQALPAAKMTADMVSSQIQDLKNDPYLPSMLGPVNSRLPNLSADSARVQAKINQLQGGAFLQARQLLKGGGAITDYEGKKAEDAYVRMNAAQSVDDFDKALDDFNGAVQQGVAKLQQQAAPVANQGIPQGGPAIATPAATQAAQPQRFRYNPATGELE